MWKYVPLFSYFPAGSIVLKCLMGVEGLVACMGLFRQILLAVDNKCIIVTITLTGLFRQILLDVNDKCRSVTIISFIIVTNWQTWPSCVDGQHKSLQAVCRFPHQHLRRQLKHTVEINHIQSHPVWTVKTVWECILKDEKVIQMQPVRLYILPGIWGHILKHTVQMQHVWLSIYSGRQFENTFESSQCKC